MKIYKTIALRALLCIVASASLEAQKIKVLVLGALNGKPYGSIEIHYVCEDGGTWSPSQFVTTNNDGLAVVPFTCATGVKFKVGTYIEGDKLSECGEMEGQTIQKSLRSVLSAIQGRQVESGAQPKSARK